jgi:hypothetical protein
MITLSGTISRCNLAAGRYRARVAQSYGSPGDCEIVSDHGRVLVRLYVGDARWFVGLFDHSGGAVSLLHAPSVEPLVEIERLGN